ncbi:hypothetical protein HYV73_04415 [Candidatus Uhrbacteria bacterium]|nr:hypothetical protein [Candidatus Uhrbacteria bacterium]
MKKFVQSLLARKARSVIRRFHPSVVIITGSVGKTSTRAAIAAVLSTKFRVRTNAENYNNEFGVPLTILGEPSPGRSALGWLRIFLKPVKDYPNMLVLEYGADQPGDLEYLCDIAAPDVAVLTAVSPVHAEHFKDIDELAQEKATVLRRCNPEGLCILNKDDERVMALKAEAAAPVQTYGFDQTADTHAEGVEQHIREDNSFEPREVFSTLSFDLVYGQTRIAADIPNRLGRPPISAALAAAAVGEHFGVAPEQMVKQFADIPMIPGRMNPIGGIKGSLLLDDSYNAAPASVSSALDVLAGFRPFEGSRRIAALGPMAELGAYSEEEHRKIGEKAARLGIDILVTVGPETAMTEFAAKEAGMKEEQTAHFGNAKEAGRWLDHEVKKGDIVLIKGSQSARMEKVVRELMAEPLRAPDLLVRQYGKWLDN